MNTVDVIDDCKSASVKINQVFSARELGALIISLMEVRSHLEPPVSLDRPGPEDDELVLIENDPALTMGQRADGSFRLWVRNRGVGWMGFEISQQKAATLRDFLIPRTTGIASDLSAADEGIKH